MGAHLARRHLWDAEVEPDPFQMPTFDPLYGFPERKERGELTVAGRGKGHLDSVAPSVRTSIPSRFSSKTSPCVALAKGPPHSSPGRLTFQVRTGYGGGKHFPWGGFHAGLGERSHLQASPVE